MKGKQGTISGWGRKVGATVLALGVVAPSLTISFLLLPGAQSQEVQIRRTGRKPESSLAPNKLPDILVAAPSTTNRITAGAIVYPASAASGDSVRIVVKIRIAPGHHIYGLQTEGFATAPTSLTVGASQFLHAKGPWKAPAPQIMEDGSKVFTGEVIFERSFEVDRHAEKTTLKVPVDIQYQVCSEAVCWPPSKLQIEAFLHVISQAKGEP